MSGPPASALDAAVSAVIPVYNGADLVAEAIESVYSQTALPSEVIVVDDGSTDGTPDILRQFEDQPGFRAVHKPNGGEASARNAGVQKAGGEFIAFLDHDDLWRQEKLERQLAAFHPAWGMSFTAHERTTPTTSEHVAHQDWDPDPRVVLARLEHGPALGPPSTWLIRRDALRLVRPFAQIDPFGTDWLMGLRLAAAGNEVGYLPEPLTAYRLHERNMSDDEVAFFDCVCGVFDLYGDRRLRAWWRLHAAMYAHEHDNPGKARRRVVQAARIRPRSIRPGWGRLLL